MKENLIVSLGGSLINHLDIKMKKLLLIFIILSATVSAQELFAQIYASDSAVIDTKVGGDINVQRELGSTLDYLRADLYFFPEEDITQKVLSAETNPFAQKLENKYRYEWKDAKGTVSYSMKTTTQTANVFNKVTKKIIFPIKNIPEGYDKYTKSTEHIDSDTPSIVKKASELAEGEDDLFIVVSKLAMWTKNTVQYNLSTLTADVSQKASWVLENKQGVCDELTSLFIAMLRSLGIPARFVSGVSFTNSPLFPDQWGAHGWAEVWFPDVGWIPFDPTFGEFGWIDPGHVKMRVSLDPSEPTTRFEWRGSKIDVDVKPFKIDAGVSSVAGKAKPVVEIKTSALNKEIDFGSYNLVIADIKNLENFYITTEAKIARVSELEILDPIEKQVILKPGEKKTLTWRVKASPALSKNFVYTIPLMIYTVRNETGTASFQSKKDSEELSLEYVTKVQDGIEKPEYTDISKQLQLSCTTNGIIMINEPVKVECTAANKGNTVLSSVNICLDSQCSSHEILIGQRAEASFETKFPTAGKKQLVVTAKSNELTRKSLVPATILDAPAATITELEYPATIGYEDEFSVQFTAEPTSYSTPQNAVAVLMLGKNEYTIDITDLSTQERIEFRLRGSMLKKETPVSMKIQYEDLQGKKYESKEERFIIRLGELTFMQKISVFFRSLFS